MLSAVVIASSVLTSTAGASHASPPTGSRLVTITIPAPNGEIPSVWLGYSGPPRADILLPANYNPHQRYPLLLLMNALSTDYAGYVQADLTATLNGLDAIVVMPEGGNGWYADWWNNGMRADPSWETYELDTVLPSILARYPILPGRQYHAIAGVSMGGLGATYLGGRLPGFFGSVASLSGFTDPGYYPELVAPAMAITAYAPFHGDDDPDPVTGPPDGFYFNGHNPTLLVSNLQYTRVFVSTGTGVPSSAGLSQFAGVGVTPFVEGVPAESAIIYPMNQLYIKALRAAGIDATYQVHLGDHINPDFANEFKAMLAWGLFKPVVNDPSTWVNSTVATQGQLWDIGYQFAKPPTAVVRFRQSANTLSVSAAGSDVTITTAHGCVLHAATPSTVRLPTTTCP